MKPAAPPVLRATRLLDQVRERFVTNTIACALSRPMCSGCACLWNGTACGIHETWGGFGASSWMAAQGHFQSSGRRPLA